MKRLLLYAATLLFTVGCAGNAFRPPPPQVTVKVPTTIKNYKTVSETNVLDIETAAKQRDLVLMSDEQLYKYVTTLNWDMFRHYSAMRVVNQYAASRGWQSPDTAPICRYAIIPDLPDIKRFKSDLISDSEELTEKLMVYIYDIQAESKVTKAVFNANRENMQFFCIY